MTSMIEAHAGVDIITDAFIRFTRVILTTFFIAMGIGLTVAMIAGIPVAVITAITLSATVTVTTTAIPVSRVSHDRRCSKR